MAILRKQFAFDLYADKNSPIFKYYNSLSSAYDAIESYMVKHDFCHRQGSVYISNNGMMDKDVRKFLLDMCENLPWLAECSKSFDVTNIGKQHDMLEAIAEGCEIFSDKKDIWLANLLKSQELEKEEILEENYNEEDELEL